MISIVYFFWISILWIVLYNTDYSSSSKPALQTYTEFNKSKYNNSSLLFVELSREQRLQVNAKMHKEKSLFNMFRVQVFVCILGNIANEMFWQGIKLTYYVLNIDYEIQQKRKTWTEKLHEKQPMIFCYLVVKKLAANFMKIILRRSWSITSSIS